MFYRFYFTFNCVCVYCMRAQVDAVVCKWVCVCAHVGAVLCKWVCMCAHVGAVVYTWVFVCVCVFVHMWVQYPKRQEEGIYQEMTFETQRNSAYRD